MREQPHEKLRATEGTGTENPPPADGRETNPQASSQPDPTAETPEAPRSAAEPDDAPSKGKAKGKGKGKAGGAKKELELITDAKPSLTAQLIGIEKLMAGPDDRSSTDPEKMQQLVESVKNLGVLQAIIVRWDQAKKKYVVVAGKRRYKAALQAGLKKVPCHVLDAERRGQDAIVAAVENDVREDMVPYDLARRIDAARKETGASYQELAKRFGLKSKGHVCEYLQLLSDEVQGRLTEEEKEKLKTGELSAKAVLRGPKTSPADGGTSSSPGRRGRTPVPPPPQNPSPGEPDTEDTNGTGEAGGWPTRTGNGTNPDHHFVDDHTGFSFEARGPANAPLENLCHALERWLAKLRPRLKKDGTPGE